MARRLPFTAGTHPPLLASTSVPGLALAPADDLLSPWRGPEEPSHPAQVLHHHHGLLSFVGVGSFLQLHADAQRRLLDGEDRGGAVGFLPAPSGAPDRVVYARGTGRVKGSGLDVRKSLHAVLVVVLSTSAYFNLTRLVLPEDAAGVDLAGLKMLRFNFARVSDPALRRRAWDLSPVGSIGALLKFGSSGSRDDQGRHQCVAVEATWTAESGIVCSCSEAENCLKDGAVCSMQEAMTNTLDSVRAALGVTTEQLFMILSASCVLRRRRAGKAVLFGDSTCLVRMAESSWQLAAVRKTRSGGWICYSCRTSDADCEHSGAAAELDKGGGDGDESDLSDDGEIDAMEDGGGNDGSGAHVNADGDPERPPCKADLLPPPPSLPSSRTQMPHYRTSPHSTLPLPIVPSVVAQQERARVLDALRDPSIILKYVAATHCHLCNLRRHPDSGIQTVGATIECGEGVAVARVEIWRCTKCEMRIIPDGRERGVVFQSASLLFCEAFLFELAVDLCRNGCSLSSSAYLREAYREMSGASTFPLSTLRLSSVTTLRSGLVLYLSLVIDGLPAAVTECLKCRRADGSYATIGFDGLQVGYGIQHILPFFRTSVRVHAVARASLIAHVITDEAICKALGRVLVSTAVPTLETSKAITTVSAIRGHVMAITLLVGYPVVNGNPVILAGPMPHAEGVTKKRGWDPAEDGGVRQELTEFFSEVFDCRRVARFLALAVVGAQYDLRSRVPDVLMRRIEALLKDGECKEPAADVVEDDNVETKAATGGVDVIQEAPGSMANGDAARGDSNEWESDGDDTQACHGALLHEVFGDDCTPTEPLYPSEVTWDDNAPLRMYAEILDEPALADTGGARAAARLRDLILPPLPHIPSTAASSIKLVDFVRAVLVDPFTVWAPGSHWGAVDALIDALSAKDFSVSVLAAVLSRVDVTEQRLLRGAVACLGPAFCLRPRVREVFDGVLKALKKACSSYDKHVSDAADEANEETLTHTGTAKTATPTTTVVPQEAAARGGRAPTSRQAKKATRATARSSPSPALKWRTPTRATRSRRSSLPTPGCCRPPPSRSTAQSTTTRWTRATITCALASGRRACRACAPCRVLSGRQARRRTHQISNTRWARRNGARRARLASTATARTLSASGLSCSTAPRVSECQSSFSCSVLPRCRPSSSTTLPAPPSRLPSCVCRMWKSVWHCAWTASTGGRTIATAPRRCAPTPTSAWTGPTLPRRRSATLCLGGSNTTYGR